MPSSSDSLITKSMGSGVIKWSQGNLSLHLPGITNLVLASWGFHFFLCK